MDNKSKVLVAMSGGIDSSMALKLLIDSGYECLACTMNLYDNETAGLDKGRTCCSLDDVFDEKQRVITKGQSAVFYDNDIVLGGGIIE